jgi:hypothetical protein
VSKFVFGLLFQKTRVLMRVAFSRLSVVGFRSLHVMKKTEQEWKALLSKDEYHVLREKGTEKAGSGEYDKFTPKEGS